MVNDFFNGTSSKKRAKSASSRINRNSRQSEASNDSEFYATRASKNPEMKLSRPQSVLPTEKSMFYYNDNETGYIKPQIVSAESYMNIGISNRTSTSNLPNSSKPLIRSSLLPFSQLTVLKLNTLKFDKVPTTANDTFTPLIADTPSVTFARPLSTNQKYPIFSPSQQSSRPQSMLAKYYNVANVPAAPMSVSQYRNYLLDLHERGIGHNSESAVTNWITLEKNAYPAVNSNNQTNRNGCRSNVKFGNTKQGYIEDRVSPCS